MTTRLFEQIFSQLSGILRRHAGSLRIRDEAPMRLSLIGGPHPKHKTPTPIAWVKIEKNYVSYHLMPVYGCPKLLETISAKLRARMQGKSCFNFRVPDDTLFDELERLTVAGFAAFKKAGYMA